MQTMLLEYHESYIVNLEYNKINHDNIYELMLKTLLIDCVVFSDVFDIQEYVNNYELVIV